MIRRVFGAVAACGLLACLTASPASAAFPGPVTEFALPTVASQPDAIAQGPDGAMWFAELAGNKIGRITAAGTITEYPIPTANAGAAGIVTGADGNLWFTESTANKIGRLTPTGTFTEFTIPTAFSQPMGITLAADGNVWFTEFGTSKVASITPTGTITEHATLFVGDTPLFITPGRPIDGAVWYSSPTGSHEGYQGLTSGVAGETTLPAPTGSLGGTPAGTPGGITTGPDGAIWSTVEAPNGGGSNSPISVLDSLNGLFSSFVGFPNADYAPRGQMITGPDGGLWYVAYGPTIVRTTAAGLTTDAQNAYPSGQPQHDTCRSNSNSQACPTNGIVFGNDQAVWFTDHSANAIGRYPTGYTPPPAGATGPAGAAGAAGPAGSAGPAGPPGPTVTAPAPIILVAFQTRVAHRRVSVRYALTTKSSITLSVKPKKGAARTVASTTGKQGVNTVSWNGKLGSKQAPNGSYKLTLTAHAGGQAAASTSTVKLR